MTQRRRFVLAVSPVVADDGSTALHLFSSDHWTTAPTDTPPNAPVRGLLRNPGTLRRELFSGARVTGAITPSYGNVVLANPAPDAAGAGELDEWVDYGLAGADVTLYWGPVGGAFPAAYTVVYVAKCHSFVADTGELTIRLRDDLQLLDQPVVTAGFAGTGGIEGTGAVAKRRQFVAGDPGLIEPILVDAVKQIYFVQSTGTGGLHDAWKTNPGAEINAFDVFINGVEVTRSASNYASADEMLASSPDPGHVKFWFGPDSAMVFGAKDGPVYFRLSGDAASIAGDVRVWAYGAPSDADAARLGVAWGSFFAPLFALRAGVSRSRLDGSSGLVVQSRLVDDDSTYLDVLADAALSYQGWFGFDRLGTFRSGYLLDPASTSPYWGITDGVITAPVPAADSVSVYTFTERQMTGQLRREPPSGMEVPVWTVSGTAGDTWPSQVAGGASDELRDYCTRKVGASFSGAASATKLRDPGAIAATVKMRGRVLQNSFSIRLWLERYLALYGGRRHFFSFTVPLSDDVLALDLHDCVTLQHRRFGCAAGVKARIVSITIDCAANVPSMRFVLWAGTPGRYTGGSSASTPGGGGGGAPAFVPPTIAQQALGDFSGFMFGSVASSGGALAGASAADMGAFTGAMLGVLSGDDAWSSVSLLLHLDGTSGTQSFTDSSGYASSVVSSGGLAVLSDAQAKFGPTSFTGGCVLAYRAAHLVLDTGDWTVEFWLYRSPSSANELLVNMAFNAGYYAFRLLWDHAAQGLQMRCYSAGGTPAQVVEVLSVDGAADNTWHHVAMVRDGSTFRLFLNGVLQGTDTYADALFDGTDVALQLGAFASGAFATVGYIDEVRVTKGVARYSGNFAPPTAAFPEG